MPELKDQLRTYFETVAPPVHADTSQPEPWWRLRPLAAALLGAAVIAVPFLVMWGFFGRTPEPQNTVPPATTIATQTSQAPITTSPVEDTTLTTTPTDSVTPNNPQQVAAIGDWMPITDGRWAYPHTVRSWTGSELLVFPEYANGLEAPATGMAYSPSSNTWRELPPTPELRGDPAAVWTGSHLIVWGGTVEDTTDGYVLSNTGFIYDPVADTWSAIPSAPLEPQTGPLSIWTGQEMIVWGGLIAVDDIFLSETNSGAAYNPATGLWRELPDSPVIPSAHGTRIVVWTGAEMIIGGNSTDMDDETSWAAYDPSTDSWRQLSEPGGSDVSVQSGVWTGTELVVAINRNSVYPAQSNLYVFDPETNEWRTAASPGTSISQAGTAWTGTHIVYWGAVGSSEESFTPSAYDPANDSWIPLTEAPLDYRFGYETLTAIGPTTILIWGGQNYDAEIFANGAILTVKGE